jgi:hypothetical protein
MKQLLMILAVVILLAPVTAAAQLNGPALSHFKCYGVRGSSPEGPPQVFLSDQFEDTSATVFEPLMLCNPVEKSEDRENGPAIAVIPAESSHLVCYATREDPRRFGERNVFVNNQFGGQQELKVSRRAMLCLPSCKDDECFNSTPTSE